MSNFKKSLEELSSKDPVISKIVKQTKLKALKPKDNYLESLVRSIVSQQLSTKAAETIYKRFLIVFKNAFPTSKVILKASAAKLRLVGLSKQKVAYIKNLAKAVEGKKVDFKRLNNMSDEQIIENLTQVKGIGRWTSEMFLIFSLNRPDVFSYGDLGLRNAIKKLYKINPKLHTRKLKNIVANWKPHRSLASRYLWASLDLK